MILFTGGAGFIGSHLVDRLIADGKDVAVIDNLSTGREENLNPKAFFIKKDIRDPISIAADIDVVFHLAAFSRVRPSLVSSSFGSQCYEVNTMGTWNILELARRMGARVVYAGSSTAQERFGSPYSYSKWVGDEHCRFFSAAYDMTTSIARFFLVYGPRQIAAGSYANVIGIFESQKRSGQPLTITGDGNQMRDFIHVSDVVDALIAMSELRDCRGREFNLGSGRNHSINEIADLFGGPREYIPLPPREARIISMNERPHWEPKIRVEDYIREVAK